MEFAEHGVCQDRSLFGKLSWSAVFGIPCGWAHGGRCAVVGASSSQGFDKKKKKKGIFFATASNCNCNGFPRRLSLIERLPRLSEAR